MDQKQIINRSYLPGLIISSLGIVALGVAASALLLHFDVYRPLDTHYSAVLTIITGIRETLAVTSLRISVMFMAIVFVGLLALIIFYTHKITGPLYRIKVSARSIAEGRLDTKVTFREKDVIKPFAESLTAMTESYSRRVSTLQSEIDQMGAAVARYQALKEKGENADDDLREIIEKDSTVRNLLNTIKT